MDDKPYEVLSPTKIWLGPVARDLCKLHNMSEREMAQHLLAQHKLQRAGLTQKEGES